jgi:tRNA(Arg) A34 adenosine deaminase TadA
MPSPDALLQRAVALARRNVREAGGYPFGAVLAHDNTVLHEAVNECAQTGDPTAHAEMVALREAGRDHGPDALAGGTMYASGIPCPMCLAAMHFAGIERVVYAFSQEDAAPYGLSTEPVYGEIRKPEADRTIEMRYNPVRMDNEVTLYQLWQKIGDDQ